MRETSDYSKFPSQMSVDARRLAKSTRFMENTVLTHPGIKDSEESPIVSDFRIITLISIGDHQLSSSHCMAIHLHQQDAVGWASMLSHSLVPECRYHHIFGQGPRYSVFWEPLPKRRGRGEGIF